VILGADTAGDAFVVEGDPLARPTRKAKILKRDGIGTRIGMRHTREPAGDLDSMSPRTAAMASGSASGTGTRVRRGVFR
jgi:hypothetical protein